MREETLQIRTVVGAAPEEVGRARRWARSQLDGHGLAPDTVDTLVLVVSELVTNAVVHTGREAVLSLAPAVGGRVRVEVADASASAPAPRDAEDDATSGRGLELVACLADRWGWYPDGQGKKVWCELAGSERNQSEFPIGH
ncbi:ATP-binding protein [Streptacidiphilus monticola]|uniref:ATP-binding protein n=1 Tax=Streptacidiphilus monticola TaxID=2161674 RepID=A0ABW1G7P9_9ACTN